MRYSVSNRQSDDEASLAELHRLAALIGVEVVDTHRGHFDAARRFRGGVVYEAGVILRQTMDDHNEVFRLGREALEAQRAGEAPDA